MELYDCGGHRLQPTAKKRAAFLEAARKADHPLLRNNVGLTGYQETPIWRRTTASL